MMFEYLLDLITPSSVLVFTVTLLLTFYVINTPAMRNMPPGPFPLPVIGNALDMVHRAGDVHPFQRLNRKYGKMYSLQVGKIYNLVISDYKLLMEAFVKKADVFSDRPLKEIHYLNYVNERLGAGIIFNHGHTWKELRRIAIMSMRDLGLGKQSMEERIHEEIVFLLNELDEKKGTPHDLAPSFHMLTSNVVSGIIFGTRFDYNDERFKELLRRIDITFNTNPLMNLDNYYPILKHLPYYKKVAEDFASMVKATTDYVKDLIKGNEDTYDPDNIRDFVDLFIKMKRERKDDESFDERNLSRVISDIFTAGSDTTALTMSWAMLYLAHHPEVQARCHREIDEVMGKGKKICATDKDKLPYVEAFIMEVIRLKPVGPLGFPHCATKDTELGGYHIPKGTVIISDLYTINHDPEIFPEPEKMDPTRHINDKGKFVTNDRIVSFSVGPRICLGESLARMELLFVIVSILQFFTIGPAPGKEVDLTPNYTLLLHSLPQDLVFTRRD